MPLAGLAAPSRIVAAALLLAAFTSVGASAGERIDDIEVRGNRRIASETIRHRLALKPGDVYAEPAANAALKALFATGQFADVRLTRENGKLIVTVGEHPAIRRVSFAGNSAVDDKAVAKAAGLAAGQPASRAVLDVARDRLMAAYAAKGTLAAIDWRTAAVEGDRADIAISIREQKFGRIDSIAFTGNRSIDAAELADVITTRAAGHLAFLQTPRPPEPDRLQHDRELLARHYRSRGFADVEVAPPLSELDPSSGNWRVTFPVVEGRPYRTGKIRIVAADSGIEEAFVRRQMRLTTGERWNHTDLERDIERVAGAVLDSGHAGIDVRPLLDRRVERGVIDVKLSLARAHAVQVVRIGIEGNSRTRDHVIRRELLLSEGAAYHTLLVERSRRRLMALGLFKSVDIEALPGKDKRTVSIVVRVEEADTRVLDWGGGYSSSEGITGDVTLTERNLLGRGQTLRLSLAGSERRIEGGIGFIEPRLLGYRLAGSFDLFYRTTDLSAISSYRSTKFGGSTGLGFEVAEGWKAGGSFALSRTTLSDVGSGASAAVRQAAGFPAATAAAYTTSAFGTSLTYDTREFDKRAGTSQPMRGVYVTSAQELAGLGGDVRHLKTTLEARGYVPVGGGAVLATRATGGTIAGWGGSEVRLLEMFYKGGETVRGFATGGIGPRDTVSANRDALGGTNFIATTAELRAPLPFTPSDFGLRIAVFADAGSLWGTSKAVKATPGVVGTSASLRASAGVGLIWDSPVGPLRVDYARAFSRQPQDKLQAVSFGLVPF